MSQQNFTITKVMVFYTFLSSYAIYTCLTRSIPVPRKRKAGNKVIVDRIARWSRIEMGGWLDLEDVPWVSIEIVLSRHDAPQRWWATSIKVIFAIDSWRGKRKVSWERIHWLCVNGTGSKDRILATVIL